MNKKIVAFTTDPIHHLQGYALVFFRIFNKIQKDTNNIDVYFCSNQGLSSSVTQNKSFTTFTIPFNNLVIKTIYSTFHFVNFGLQNKKYDALIVNFEIPELLAAVILKHFFGYQNIYCIVQDMRYRKPTLFFTVYY